MWHGDFTTAWEGRPTLFGESVTNSGTSTLKSSRFTHRQAQLGTLLFAVGICVFLLAAWDNSSGLPFAMPALWHNQRMLCLLVALALAGFGWFALINGPTDEDVRRGTSWRPTRPGRRFRSLTVYSRQNCHLCDEAIELLQLYSTLLPPIHEIDIDTDPTLQKRFDIEVPVVEFDGRVRFKGCVSVVLLRRLIEGTPPA